MRMQIKKEQSGGFIAYLILKVSSLRNPALKYAIKWGFSSRFVNLMHHPFFILLLLRVF